MACARAPWNAGTDWHLQGVGEMEGRGTDPSNVLQPQVLQRQEEMHHMQQDSVIPALAEAKEFSAAQSSS